MEITTITIPKRIKQELEEIKKDLTWAEFFEKIIEFFKKKRKILLAKRLEDIGYPKIDLEEIKVKLRWKKQ